MSKKLVQAAEEEKEVEVTNVIPLLSLLPGGKDPNNCWLKNLTEGSFFVVKRKNVQMGVVQQFLDEFQLVNNRNKTFLLAATLTPTDTYLRVLPEDFCKVNDLVEVLEEGQE